jgi:phosphatidylglycerol---prolipoprotein diacylglyceryl transferase
MFPIHLNLGFRTFYFYEGFYFLAAIVVAYIWASRRIRANGLSEERFDLGLIGAFVGLILGARITHFLFWDFDYFLRDPAVFFKFWDGGLSVVGGLAGGIAGGAVAFIGKKDRFAEYFSVISPAVLLGQAIGRIGCFMNGDAWGLPTSLPWGVRIAKYGTTLFSGQVDKSLASNAWIWARERGLMPAADLRTPPLHPTALYEALGDVLLLLLVLGVLKAFGKERGGTLVLALHAGGYCLLRFLLEFIRGDREQMVFAGMSALQLVLAACAAALLAFAAVRSARLARPAKAR